MTKKNIVALNDRMGGTAVQRGDAMIHTASGRGTSSDKLSGLRPNPRGTTYTDARRWYYSNGFIQTIVDAPAEDATREWISIKTNLDKDYNISRMIENRLEELSLQEKLLKLIRYSRMYNEGGYFYYGIKSTVPQWQQVLAEPIPADIMKLDYINVFGPDQVSFRVGYSSPLSKYYHAMRYTIGGYDVHESRISHMINNFIEEEVRGVSVIDTILDAIFAQDTSLWSVTSLIFEMSVWVFKSPLVEDMKGSELYEFLAKMKGAISTQSCFAMGEMEDIKRIVESAPTGLKDILDFIFENLAGLAKIPKSRLMGQAQGVVTAGMFDLRAYYDNVAKFQENQCRPIIEKVIDIVVHETEGEIFKTLGNKVAELDWSFEFRPLYRLTPTEIADVELKQAQRDQIYITTGVLTPSEVRDERFGDLLEAFPAWENQPLDLSVPPEPPIVNQEKQPLEASPDAENALISGDAKKGLFGRFLGKEV